MPKLHQRVPLHLFPENLVVYDPDNTLSVQAHEEPQDQSKPLMYKLHLTPSSQALVNRQREELASAPQRKHGLLLISETSAIFAEYPPPPPRLLRTESATLKLSDESFLGSGHHSFVYNAGWEVPRSWFIDPDVCQQCGLEALLTQLKKSSPDVVVNETLDTEQNIATLLGLPLGPQGSSPFKVTRIDVMAAKIQDIHSGPITTIPVDISWSQPGYFYACKHSPPNFDHSHSQPKRRRTDTASPAHISPSSTVNVSVAAKLSMQYDTQLVAEARNYQRFPEGFFEHWSGYSLVPPLQDPTPCGPVVPQFYGYYMPVRDKGNVKQYLSPILLMEHCGQSIDSIEMTLDDK